MSCYHPLVGVWKGEYTENGKRKYQIIGNVDPRDCPDDLPHILIPCGHCIGCRLDYSRSWADRMVLELQTSGTGVFVTLTYDNDHVPFGMVNDDGSAASLSLDKRDCQLFMKNLRKYFSDRKVRFYLCGEYGENTHRPHYHAILFGLSLSDFPDLVKHGKNELGQVYYISDTLSKIWKNGFVLISDVSWKTCAYVARYVTKKLNGDASIIYAESNIVPEFSLMSRKPGIGKYYLMSHPECLDDTYIIVSDADGGRKIRIPKYFLKQLKFVPKSDINPLYNPEKYVKISQERKEFAEDSMLIKLSKTSLSYLDYLEVEENNKLDSIKALKRNKTD